MQRWLAARVARAYALLPIFIAAILAGLVAGVPGGRLAALIAVLVLAVAWSRLTWFARHGAAPFFNGALFFVALVLPSLFIAPGDALAFALGVLLGTVLTIALVIASPAIDRASGGRLQLELFPDLFTSVILLGLFSAPISMIRRLRKKPLQLPRGPFRVSVIVSSYNEAETIARCLDSIAAAVKAAAAMPGLASLRVVLADSGSTDATREHARLRVDEILESPPGKLRARHDAILREACDIVVAADGDRAYPRDWLTTLLPPLLDGTGTVAVTGETRNAGRPTSGTALARALLKMPFNGGNSAFFKSVYERVPFDQSGDQSNHGWLWCEEEFLFPLRLAESGRVAYALGCESEELRPYPLIDQLQRHVLGKRLKTF